MERDATYEAAKDGIPSRLAMSSWIVETLSEPCFWINESSLSFLRPTAVTWEPLLMIFSARARPMPDVAPMTRTFL